MQDVPGVAVPPGPPDITFDGVSFRYRGGPLVLHHLSVHVAPGRLLGVVGRTGSGKTTLTRLLVRFYDPTAGTIQWGHADVRALQLAGLRRRVGLVTQDVHVFTASVRDNLTLFGVDILDEQILHALGDLGLMEWRSGGQIRSSCSKTVELRLQERSTSCSGRVRRCGTSGMVRQA